jgi:hypothetical protein
MNAEHGVLLSTDLHSPESIPYFLWDEPMTVAEFRERLQNRLDGGTNTPAGQVAARSARHRCLAFHLAVRGLAALAWPLRRAWRRRSFWEFLFSQWRKKG